MSILIESATYTPNVFVNDEIARQVTGYTFVYPVTILYHDKEYKTDMVVDMNEDDIYTEETSNCIYSYIDSTKINYQLTPLTDVDNWEDISHNLRFAHKDYKTWKSDTLLYLLKINKNSGIIGRYDSTWDRFRTQDLNWNQSSPDGIIRDILTKDYLDKYFQDELSVLEVTI